MDNINIKEKLITAFLKENFKNETNILLFGSNKEEYNKNSDIDILIVSNHSTVFVKETYCYKNQLFDVIIIPIYEINSYLEKDKFVKVYVDILLKGKIIIDNNDILKNLIIKIKNSSIPENSYLRKIQIEKNISFFISKMSTSKNIYEAEIYFNKVSENIYIRRLLDFGICNIDSSKHLVNKIIDIDFYLVDAIYKLKKKLMQFQDIILVINDLKKIINLNAIWNNEYYSNKFILSQIYENRIVVYVENNTKNIQKIERFLKSKSIVYYRFSIDNNNIYKEGKYYVIMDNIDTIKSTFIPNLEEIFFKDENLIFNDSKIIFPFQIDIQVLLGITDKNIFIEVEKLFLIINDLKSKKIDDLIFYVFFEIINHIKLSLAVENLIYIFAGKSSLLYNNVYQKESINCLIDLKNRYFDNKVFLSDKEINEYREKIKTFNSVFNEDIKLLKSQLIKVFMLISKEDKLVIFGVTNLIFDLFDVNDYKKPYIISIVKKIFKNEL
jgi:predicted nucleotidyltransferase